MKKLFWTACAVLLVGVQARTLHAAYPLRVDDAETVEEKDWEVVSAVEYLKGGSSRAIALPHTISYGLSSRIETGVEFGYQFASERSEGRRQWNDGWMDTTLSLKGSLLQQERHFVSLSAEGVVKFPTASRSQGLGTGHTDFGFLIIATRNLGETFLDLNVGYTMSRVFRGQREADQMFYGISLRRPWGERLELFTEVFAEMDIDDFDAAVVMGRGGMQLQVTSKLFLGVGVGGGITRQSPDLTATTGLTLVF